MLFGREKSKEQKRNEAEISRRKFLAGLGATGASRLPGIGATEAGVALAAGVIDVGVNALLNKANAQEAGTEYVRPKEWTKLEIGKGANLSPELFPPKLEFAPGKQTLIVSAVWQTAALYDARGYLVKVNGQEMKFLASTGKVDHLTELGLYQIQTKNSEKHRSSKYKVRGVDGKELGALMPFAKHIGKGRIDPVKGLVFDPHDGTAIHARDNVSEDSTTSFMSHGCIGLPYSIAKFFQDRLSIGDQVMVIGEKIPSNVSSVSDVVRKLNEENPAYIEYMKREVRLKPEEVQQRKQCFIFCTSTGENAFDFMSSDPKLNPYRERDGTTVRIPQTGQECAEVRKFFLDQAVKMCRN